MDEKRPEEALTLFRAAIYDAQRADAPEQHYRWQWRLGSLLAHRGELDPALDAYRSSVSLLAELRRRSGLASPETTRDSVEPVHLELVDLLLQRVAIEEDDERRQRLLFEARDVVETLRRVELEDYFRDECVAEAHTTAPDEVPGAALRLARGPLPDREDPARGRPRSHPH